MRSRRLRKDFAVAASPGRKVEVDPREQRPRALPVVTSHGVLRGQDARVLGQIMHAANGEVNVRGELVGSKHGRAALVALDGILLRRGDIVGVGVGGSRDESDDILADVAQGLGAEGLAPAAAAHGGDLAGADGDDELAEAQDLDVDDARGPGVGSCEAGVEDDGLGGVAGARLGRRAAHAREEERPGVGARLVYRRLVEARHAGAVGAAG